MGLSAGSGFAFGQPYLPHRWQVRETVRWATQETIALTPGTRGQASDTNTPNTPLLRQRVARDRVAPATGPKHKAVTWLILPVVICLSQRLSHACLSINCLYGETANGSLNQLEFI
jgi:hypothetical protein